MQRRRTFFRFPSLSSKASAEASDAPGGQPEVAAKPENTPEQSAPVDGSPSARRVSENASSLPHSRPTGEPRTFGPSGPPPNGVHPAGEAAEAVRCTDTSDDSASTRHEKPSDPSLPSPSPHCCLAPPPCPSPPSPLTCLTPVSGVSSVACGSPQDASSRPGEDLEDARGRSGIPHVLDPIEEGKAVVLDDASLSGTSQTPVFPGPPSEHRDAGTAEHDAKVLGNYQVLGEIAMKKKSSLWLCKRRDDAQPRGDAAAREPAPSELFAIKEIQKASVLTQKQTEHLWNERQLLEEIAFFPEVQCSVHRLVETFKSDAALFFVFEAVLGGPLHRHIRFEGGFGVDRVRWYSAELVLILEALHKRGILYRDLQASNVMLSDDGRIKLVDFGLAKNIERDIPPCGTPSPSSPSSSSPFPSSSPSSSPFPSSSPSSSPFPSSSPSSSPFPSSSPSSSPFPSSSSPSSPAHGSQLARTFSYCGTLHAMAPEVIAEGNRATACAQAAGASPRKDKKRHAFGLFGEAATTGSASHGARREKEGFLFKSASSFAPIAGKSKLFPRLAEPRSRSRSSEPKPRGNEASNAPAREDANPARTGGYSFPADWWSLGVVIFEMLYNTVPFGYHDYENERSRPICELVKSSPSTVAFPRDRRVPDEAKDLILRLLQADPEKRLGRHGAGEVKRHAFFRTIDWDVLDSIRQAPTVPPSLRHCIPEVERGLGLRPFVEGKKEKQKAEGDPFADF